MAVVGVVPTSIDNSETVNITDWIGRNFSNKVINKAALQWIIFTLKCKWNAYAICRNHFGRRLARQVIWLWTMPLIRRYAWATESPYYILLCYCVIAIDCAFQPRCTENGGKNRVRLWRCFNKAHTFSWFRIKCNHRFTWVIIPKSFLTAWKLNGQPEKNRETTLRWYHVNRLSDLQAV